MITHRTPTLADTGQDLLASQVSYGSGEYEPRAEILMSAAGCILADRAQAYGQPEDNFANIVAFWNAYLAMRTQGPKAGLPLDGTDQAVMMTLMKIARLATNPGHKDSYIDAVGYLACAWRCEALRLGLLDDKAESLVASDATWDPEDDEAEYAREVEYLCGCPSCQPEAWGEDEEASPIPVSAPQGDDEEKAVYWPAPGGMTYGEAVQVGKTEVFDWARPLDGEKPEWVTEERWAEHLQDLAAYAKRRDDRTRWYTPWDRTENHDPYTGPSVSYPDACRFQRRAWEAAQG